MNTTDEMKLETTDEALRNALAWYGEQARLARLVHSEGDPGRWALAKDGGKRAREVLALSASPDGVKHKAHASLRDVVARNPDDFAEPYDPAGVKPQTMEDIHREQLDRDRLKPAGVGVEATPPQTHSVGDAIRILHEGIDGAEADMQSDVDAGERVDLFDYEISLPYETAREIAALLREAHALPNLSGWRDVNTAPIGKSVIICTWWKHSPSSDFCAEGYLDRDTKTWRNQDGSPISEDRTQPTHWMHIPEGPNSTPITPTEGGCYQGGHP